MAERRMFTKKVTDDDNFMALSSSAQALYLHLNMSADDDGFNNQVTICMFKAHASLDDLQALLERRYLYQFDNGVIVIKHWRMANALRKDRYTPTAFQEELAKLQIKDNGSYTLGNQTATTWQPNGNQMATQYSIGKNSIDKVNNILSDKSDKQPPQRKRFLKPSVEEIQSYCNEKGYVMDPQYFFDYYEAKGWLVGKTPMKDWKAAVRNWAKNEKEWKPKKEEKVFQSTGSTIEKKEVDPEIERMLREYGTIDD